VIIDDIEDREAAASDVLIAKNEQILEQDIAGLGASAERVARAMLCTIQNRKCNAYKYTDPKIKPSWKGKRYRKMLRPPDRMDLVQKYIEMRKLKGEDDPDARVAFRFWRDNIDDIERGCIVSNPQSYSKKLHADGDPLELTAIQAYYNRVADWGEKAVATEIDNDPPETVGPQGSGLTAEMVLSRNSGLQRMQLPASTVSLTAAIDLGKYSCHWVVIAWFKGGGGCVVDYGVAEVKDTETAMNHEASEPMIYRALLNWRDELLAKEYVDASGERRRVDCVFVDSGAFTNAAYEFVRQVGAPFYASKGIPNYRPKTQSNDKCKAGDNMHAQYLEADRLWLFELNTDYWKQWVHERFMAPTFDDTNMLRRGALSIFDPGSKKHLSFAKHITAEELLTEFKEGKGAKTYWHVHNENNHWLDATYNCCAAGRYTGVALLVDDELPKVAPREVQEKPKQQPKPKVVQHGQRFRTRPGGWVNGARRR
jgi:phage terminase large subunit GpA-like protein